VRGFREREKQSARVILLCVFPGDFHPIPSVTVEAICRRGLRCCLIASKKTWKLCCPFHRKVCGCRVKIRPLSLIWRFPSEPKKTKCIGEATIFQFEGNCDACNVRSVIYEGRLLLLPGRLLRRKQEIRSKPAVHTGKEKRKCK